jgi:hypothetical protein
MTRAITAKAKGTAGRNLIVLVLFGLTAPVQAVAASGQAGTPAFDLTAGSGNGNGNGNVGSGNGNGNQGNDNGNDNVGSFNGNFNPSNGNGNGYVGNGFGNGLASNCVSNNGRDNRDEVVIDIEGTRLLIHCHCLLTRNTSSAHNCIEIVTPHQ